MLDMPRETLVKVFDSYEAGLTTLNGILYCLDGKDITHQPWAI